MAGRKGPNIVGERKEQLSALCREYYVGYGMTCDEIARVLDTSRNTVSKLLREQGIERGHNGSKGGRQMQPASKGRTFTPEEEAALIDTLVQEYNWGISPYSLAKSYGVSRDWIINRLKTRDDVKWRRRGSL